MGRHRIRHASAVMVAALAAALLVGGAVGVIVGATSVPKINACVQANGLMRYASTATCKAGEKLLTWNTQGVAGAKGATGAPGPAGTTGAQGQPGSGSGGGAPGFFLANGDIVQANSANSAFTVVTLKVAAGSYLIDFDGVVYTGGEFADGRCQIDSNPNADPLADTGGISKADVYGAGFGGPISLRGYAEFSQPTTIYGRCALDAPVVAIGQLVASSAKKQPTLP